MNITRLFSARTGRREIISVFALWALLLIAALGALLLLNGNAVRLINHIEYVKAGRYIRMLALYEEGRKHADLALTRAGRTEGFRIAQSDPDYQKAVQLYARAFDLDPRGTLTPDHGVYHQLLMRLHEAAQAQSPMLASTVRDALTRGDFSSAAEFAARLTSSAPGEPESWRLAAEVALRSGALDEATSAASRMASVAGESSQVHELRGRVAVRRNDPAAAAREYAEAVKLSPRNVDLRKELANQLESTGRSGEALKVLVEGRSLGGEQDGNYMHRLGESLLLAGRGEDAVSALLTAAALEPHSADVQWSLARAFQKAGNPQRAERAMQRAYALNPELRKKVLEK